MGGNALKFDDGTTTQRLPLAEYKRVTETLLAILCAPVSFENNETSHYYDEVTVPRTLPGKVDFGDVDILVTTRATPPTEKKSRRLTFDPISHPLVRARKVVRHGPVMSFDYENYQVDLITVDNISWAKVFYNWGDFGMILGILFRSLGLQFTPGELNILFPSTGSWRPSVTLTTDIRAVFSFLGWDWDSYQSALETATSMDNVFQFLASTKYWRPHIFLHPSRIKSHGDRKMYMALVEWIKKQQQSQEKNEAESETKIESEALKDKMRHVAIDFFDKRPAYNAVIDELTLQKLIANKFNGRLVSRVTGLKGEALGAAIRDFKKSKSRMPKEVTIKSDDSTNENDGIGDESVEGGEKEVWKKYVLESTLETFEADLCAFFSIKLHVTAPAGTDQT